MGCMGVLLGVRVGGRNPHQSAVAISSPQGNAWTLLLALFSAAAALTLFGSPTMAAEANDVRDVTLRAGPQLEQVFEARRKENPDIRAAASYFEDQKLKLYPPGLAALTVRTINTNETTDLFIIPFSEPIPPPGLQHVVVSVAGTNGSAVVLGTIAETKEQNPTAVKPVVKEEYRAVGGKIQPGNHALAKWLLCTLGTCMTGVACFAAGPDPLAIGCICAVCAGGAIACSKDLLD